MSIRNKVKEGLCYYILGLIVLLFGIIMAGLYSVPIISKGLVFSIYTLVGMLLPGYAIVNLLKIKCKSDVELITYTVFFGYFISFLEYFFVVPFGIQDYAFVVWIFFTMISTVYLLIKNRKLELIKVVEKDNFGMWTCMVLVLVVIFVKCGLYAGQNLLPYDEVQITGIHEDLLYWIGNTVELTKRFPPFNFRNYGYSYNYHYFTSVQLAMTSLGTGIGAGLLSLCFSYIYPSLMLVFGGYVVFSKCTQNNILRVGAMLAFLFTSGFSDITDNRYAGYMYEYPFAFDYGIAVFLFLTFLVINQLYKEKMTIKDISIIAAFFVLLCGIKANNGAIALVGMGMCCLRWFFQKEQRKKAIILGSIALGIFVVVYVLVTNLKGYSGTIANEFMSSNLLTNGSGYGDGRLAAVYEKLLSRGVPSLLAAPAIGIIYTVLSQPLVFVIMAYQIIRAIAKKQKLAEGSICLLAMVFAGAFITSFIGMYGWSERYFIYNTFPVGIMFVLLNWQTGYSKEIGFKAKMGVVVGLFAVSFYGLIKYDGRLSFVQDIGRGYSRYLGSDYYVDYKNILTKKQLEAYEWLADNADRYDLALTNHSRTEWEINVFTECNLLYDLDSPYPASWGIYVKADGGDYNQHYVDDFGFRKVFENEEVEIYGK